jgi:hypothetical protein
MPVSELEKKPERKISATRMEKSNPSGASFKADSDLVGESGCYLEEKAELEQVPKVCLCGYLRAVQYQFQHQFRAEKGQHQHCKARQC